MNTHISKQQEDKNRAVANNLPKQQNNSKPALQLVENTLETVAQTKLQHIANNSPKAKQLKVYQAMANSSSKTMQHKENIEEETLQGKFKQIQKKENNSSLKKQSVIQRALDPDQLKGLAKSKYRNLEASMKTKYPDDWERLLTEVGATEVEGLALKVTAFLQEKVVEKIKTAKAALEVETKRKATEDAEARRVRDAGLARAEAERVAAEEAAKKAEEAAAITEPEAMAEPEPEAVAEAVETPAEAATRIAAETATRVAAEIAEKTRLAAKFNAGTHTILDLKDIQGYVKYNYSVTHGEEYKRIDGSKKTKVKNYGIYINIKPANSRGAVMTTHFHVHDNIGIGTWDAHFKSGKRKNANQGLLVDKADALILFGLLGYKP